MARPAAALALAALVVLSGCSALFGTTQAPTTTPATTSEETTDGESTTPLVRVLGGSLGVDAERALERTGALLGVNRTPPVRIVVESEVPEDDGTLPAFYRHLGFEREPGYRSPPVAWIDPRGFRVHVAPGDARPAAVEAALVRAFVRVYQRRGQGIVPSSAEGEWGVADLSTSGYLTVQRGVALAVADRYAARYLEGVDPMSAAVDRARAAAPGERLLGAPVVGARYVAWWLREGHTVADLYRTPPRSVEQLLHRRPPGVDPPAPLAVDARSARWTALHEGRQGELTLRLALSTALTDRTAARAADGWGADRLLAFRRGDRRGYAWVLRWDDAANATAFLGAARTALDERGRRAFGAWYVNGTAHRLVRVAPETTVWLLGDPAFVTGASAGGTVGNVTVAT